MIIIASILIAILIVTVSYCLVDRKMADTSEQDEWIEDTMKQFDIKYHK